jgi:hypothetical protein
MMAEEVSSRLACVVVHRGPPTGLHNSTLKGTLTEKVFLISHKISRTVRQFLILNARNMFSSNTNFYFYYKKCAGIFLPNDTVPENEVC